MNYTPAPTTVRSPWLTIPDCEDLFGSGCHDEEVDSERAELSYPTIREDEPLLIDGIAASEVVTRIAPGLVMTEHPPEVITCLTRQPADPARPDDRLNDCTVLRRHWAARIQVAVQNATDRSFEETYDLFRRALKAVTPQGFDWYLSDVEHSFQPALPEYGWTIEIFTDLGDGSYAEDNLQRRHVDEPIGAHHSWADNIYVLLCSVAAQVLPAGDLPAPPTRHTDG